MEMNPGPNSDDEWLPASKQAPLPVPRLRTGREPNRNFGGRGGGRGRVQGQARDDQSPIEEPQELVCVCGDR